MHSLTSERESIYVLSVCACMCVCVCVCVCVLHRRSMVPLGADGCREGGQQETHIHHDIDKACVKEGTLC